MLSQALRLRAGHGKLTHLDSIHVATALVEGLALITSDETIVRVASGEGVNVIPLGSVESLITP